MGCKYSRETDEYYGYECTITDDSCVYKCPNQKKCIKDGYIDDEESD